MDANGKVVDHENHDTLVQINKKNTVHGKFSYEELEQAGKFAEEMRQKYYGEFAGGN